jgi:hypothetical protein
VVRVSGCQGRLCSLTIEGPEGRCWKVAWRGDEVVGAPPHPWVANRGWAGPKGWVSEEEEDQQARCQRMNLVGG